jgi:hypothetical protein
MNGRRGARDQRTPAFTHRISIVRNTNIRQAQKCSMREKKTVLTLIKTHDKPKTAMVVTVKQDLP